MGPHILNSSESLLMGLAWTMDPFNWLLEKSNQLGMISNFKMKSQDRRAVLLWLIM